MTKKLGITGLVLLASLPILTGCVDKTSEVLNSYCGKENAIVYTDEGYNKFSLMLKKKYPEKLKDIHYQDISTFLYSLNGKKQLKAYSDIILPKYDCKK